MPDHQVYEKKTPREHVLLRPDMYIGPVTPESKTTFVLDADKLRMVEKKLTQIPGLLKIVDEILVNAIDNKQRDKAMSYIKVTVDREKGEIVVENDGLGIPVVKHEKYGIYVPELIFGEMLTSSNFNDTVKRVVGGRNGYGAKLTNIFSKVFVVETCDGKNTFKQVHKNNMTEKSAPQITKVTKAKNFTRITFVPDLSRFGLKQLDDDIYSLIERRVYDVGGVSDRSVKVYINGSKVPVASFQDYLKMFVPGSMPIMYQKVNERWEIGVSLSDGHFRQVSYVNGMFTSEGGRHCDYIADMVAKYVTSKKKDLKPRQIKDFMFLFVNCLIENPAFKSQTKDELTTKIKDFGSKCDIPEAFLKKVAKSQIVVEAIEMSKHKEARIKARKTDGKKTSKIFGITKLTDARHAGTKMSMDCTLILVEGDSAKTLALAGIPSIKGTLNQHFFGIYPLKGKVLNVRDANVKQIAKNPEITNIKKIMGLRDGVDYNDEKNYNQLRYGHVMIMVDQDYDGSHIKGLLINLFHIFWPSLIKRKNFLLEFVTPIVVCKKGQTRKEFFTIPEYENWKTEFDTKAFEIKYYKGLGTSSNAEAEQYFSDLKKHQIKFEYAGEKDDQAISLAFSKSKAEERKQWLAGFIPGTYLDHNTDVISYDEFINKELILFSMADNQRSIPSMIDGLKPGQRKILHSCLRRNLTKSSKVPQIAGFVMSDTAYHHGDAALQGTIIKMAQDFCGSSNLNLLLPQGQFGSRSQGGKDAANARYISTHLNPVTRLVFHKDDSAVLRYLNDDGIEIEPEWFVPTIPMVLVNGAEGIGTGWSSSIPVYRPDDIITAIRAKINGVKYPALHPWYRNWKGSLRFNPVKKDYAMVGRVQVVDPHTLRITELPVKTWTEPYKEHLAKLYEDGVITNILEEHSIDGIDFTLETSPQNPVARVTDFLLKTLRLTGTISMTNIVLFDKDGKLKRYGGPDEIIDEFFGLKMEFLLKRKEHIIKTMELELKIIENKARFIIAIVKKELKVTNRPKKDVFRYLKANNFDLIHKNDQKDETGENEDRGFDYLLSMSIWALTTERFEKLKNDAAELRQRLEDYRKVTISQIWLDDLAALEAGINEFYDTAAKANAGRKRKAARKPAKKGKSRPAATKAAAAGGKSGKSGIFTKAERDKGGIFSKIITNESWEATDLAAKEKKAPKIAETKTKDQTANGRTKAEAKAKPEKIVKITKTDKIEKTIKIDETDKIDETKKTEKPQKKAKSGEAEEKQNGKRDSDLPPKKKAKVTELINDEKCFDTTSSSEERSESSFVSEIVGDGESSSEEEESGVAEEADKNGEIGQSSDFWNCHLCTFQNISKNESCEVCCAERE